MDLKEKIRVNALELFNSFNSLNKDKVGFKPEDNVWSVLETLEHIFLINKAVYKAISSPPLSQNSENNKVELLGQEKINKLLVINRSFKVPAPDFSKPKGSIASVEDAKQHID